jgi:DNA modification methylase
MMIFLSNYRKKRNKYKSLKNEQTSGQYFTSLKKNRSYIGYEPQTGLAKEWAGWKYGKQSVRPSMEPIYFGQKPPLRPLTKNVKVWEVGALNIEGCKTKEKDGRIRETSSVLMDDSCTDLLCEQDQKNMRTISKISRDSFIIEPKPSRSERKGIHHPTLKPVALMQRLTRLITPPRGTCLDPFMGSGTTGVACQKEGISFIGIEREKEYFDLAKNRLNLFQNKLAS